MVNLAFYMKNTNIDVFEIYKIASNLRQGEAVQAG